MFLARLSAVAVFVIAAGSFIGSHHQESPAHRTWPPGVQKVPAAAPPLSPADALKTFYMPPGYRVELVASEPLIQEPVAIDWDPRRTALGGRDARLHARHQRGQRARPDRPRGRAARTRTATAGWTHGPSSRTAWSWRAR